MTPICHPIVWKLSKNEQVLRLLLLRQGPAFVRRRRAAPPEREIPVFTFHAVHADVFEAQCRHLVENGYGSLSLEEFEAGLDRGSAPPRKRVLLTFDDGLREVWTIAFPLLRKYGLQAVCFLIPGLIPRESPPPRPGLEQVWKGEIPLPGILAGHPGESPMCTWDEIRTMHESGVVAFQSHSMHHALVFTSPRIFDFAGPDYDPYFYGNIHVPIYRRHGTDVVTRDPLAGLPIYYARPRLGAERRFLDDERIRDLCLAEVERGGGASFFEHQGWRRRLLRLVAEERRRGASRERFETIEERDREVLAELVESRRVIEERLPGRKVTHFCYPWYEAAPFAPPLVRQAGYRYQHFGQLTDRRVNRPGEGSGHVTRIDELFLFRLPGAGRRTLRALLSEAYFKRRPAPGLRSSRAAAPRPPWRLCLLSESYIPNLDGQAIHCRSLAAALQRRGIPVLVITRRRSKADREHEVIDGVRVTRVGPLRGRGILGRYVSMLSVLPPLWARRDEFDVLLVSNLRILGLPGITAARLLGRPCLLRTDSEGEMSGAYVEVARPLPAWERGLAHLWFRARNLLLRRGGTGFISISRPVRREFEAAGIEAARIHDIANGVDTDRFHPLTAEERRSRRLELGLPPQGPIVGYTGRLTREKGLMVLLEAWARLAPHPPGARLVIVGAAEGMLMSCEKEMRAFVAERGLGGSVIFTGRIDAVETWVQAMDVFVLLSRTEALPIALLEAMACGAAPLASRVGGIPEIVEDGVNGRLVPPDDADAAATGLGLLMADAGLRARYAAAGRRTVVERFGIEHIVDQYVDLIETIGTRPAPGLSPGSGRGPGGGGEGRAAPSTRPS